MEPPSLLPHVDELIMEYLLFRGFTKSFQAFAAERKRDRARGFDVDQIAAQLLLSIQTYQVESVLETWKFLSARFFHHLDASYAGTLQKLENSLLRLYVVNAVKTGHREKAAEFFKRFANRLHATISMHDGDESDSWARWFVLPYIEHPETDPYFQVFFSKEWLEAFVTSLRNFLSLVFRNLPLPKLLAIQLTRLQDPALKMRLRASQAECTRLRSLNQESGSKIKKLEEAGRQLHTILRMMVQHNFLEHFSDSSVNPAVDSSNGHTSANNASRNQLPNRESSLGLSRQQMKELGELFGIASKDSSDIPVFYPPVMEPPSPEQYLSEERSSDDAFAVDSELSDSASPPFSPLQDFTGIAVLEPHAELPDGEEDLDMDMPRPSEIWSTNPNTPAVLSPQQDDASLIREINLLNAWEPSSSAMAMQTRFSQDGAYLAVAQVGNSQVDIWSPDTVELTPTATIDAGDQLTGVTWFPVHNDQSVLCTVHSSSIKLWKVDDEALLFSISTEPDTLISHLVCANDAACGLCVFTNTNGDAQGDGSMPQHDVRVLDVSSGSLDSKSILRTDGDVTCVALGYQGRLAVVGNSSGQLQFVDALHRDHVETWTPDVSYDPSKSIAAVCLSPDGSSMLTVDASGYEVLEWKMVDFLDKFLNDGTARGEDDDAYLASQPILSCRYKLSDQTDESDELLSQVSIRYLHNGLFFTVAHSRRVHLFKRGQKVAIDTAMLQSGVVSDVDGHPTRSIWSTVSQDGTVGLWDVKSLVGSV